MRYAPAILSLLALAQGLGCKHSGKSEGPSEVSPTTDPDPGLGGSQGGSPAGNDQGQGPVSGSGSLGATIAFKPTAFVHKADNDSTQVLLLAYPFFPAAPVFEINLQLDPKTFETFDSCRFYNKGKGFEASGLDISLNTLEKAKAPFFLKIDEVPRTGEMEEHSLVLACSKDGKTRTQVHPFILGDLLSCVVGDTDGFVTVPNKRLPTCRASFTDRLGMPTLEKVKLGKIELQALSREGESVKLDVTLQPPFKNLQISVEENERKTNCRVVEWRPSGNRVLRTIITDLIDNVNSSAEIGFTPASPDSSIIAYCRVFPDEGNPGEFIFSKILTNKDNWGLSN